MCPAVTRCDLNKTAHRMSARHKQSQHFLLVSVLELELELLVVPLPVREVVLGDENRPLSPCDPSRAICTGRDARELVCLFIRPKPSREGSVGWEARPFLRFHRCSMASARLELPDLRLGGRPIRRLVSPRSPPYYPGRSPGWAHVAAVVFWPLFRFPCHCLWR